jgi:hypothetical protein
MKPQKTPNSQNYLEQKDKAGGIKLYYRTRITEKAWNCHENRSSRRNRTDPGEISTG